jgi:hypothetical protein
MGQSRDASLKLECTFPEHHSWVTDPVPMSREPIGFRTWNVRLLHTERTDMTLFKGQ